MAPQIKEIKSEVSIVSSENGESKAQAIVSWSTDEPSTSQLSYAKGSAVNVYNNNTEESKELTTSHILIISNLDTSSTYHMKVVSKDSSGNIGTSDDYTVITLNQEQSLTQYIIQVLSSKFSWVQQYLK